ncbi:hypothetical protein HAX54_040038 [Datura stramonium]|uniref:Uncharacterized protein n=1 Tax=Datura stramonium TaxID=4076 RepID=A0ABS8SJN0_DATST|nr:hypothetical protein [Datura stramonium]
MLREHADADIAKKEGQFQGLGGLWRRSKAATANNKQLSTYKLHVHLSSIMWTSRSGKSTGQMNDHEYLTTFRLCTTAPHDPLNLLLNPTGKKIYCHLEPEQHNIGLNIEKHNNKDGFGTGNIYHVIEKDLKSNSTPKAYELRIPTPNYIMTGILNLFIFGKNRF